MSGSNVFARSSWDRAREIARLLVVSSPALIIGFTLTAVNLNKVLADHQAGRQVSYTGLLRNWRRQRRDQRTINGIRIQLLVREITSGDKASEFQNLDILEVAWPEIDKFWQTSLWKFWRGDPKLRTYGSPPLDITKF